MSLVFIVFRYDFCKRFVKIFHPFFRYFCERTSRVWRITHENQHGNTHTEAVYPTRTWGIAASTRRSVHARLQALRKGNYQDTRISWDSTTWVTHSQWTVRRPWGQPARGKFKANQQFVRGMGEVKKKTSPCIDSN